jgi:hypothetical protein
MKVLSMKITILPFVLSFLLCGTMLFGQYPVNEKIQPYPAPVKERVLRQCFLCDMQGAAKWTALHQTMLMPLGESLQVESNGHDPYILLPPVEGERTGTFEFRIRMKSTMNPAAEIFWATTQQPDFQANNAVRFDFLPDGNWYTYTVEFTTTDPLTKLRFDPGTSAGVTEIAWVELYDIVRGDVPENPTPWVDPHWGRKVKLGKTISSGNIKINFDSKGIGAVVLLNNKAIGEIYPLAYHNPSLPLGGVKHIPFYKESSGGVSA